MVQMFLHLVFMLNLLILSLAFFGFVFSVYACLVFSFLFHTLFGHIIRSLSLITALMMLKMIAGGNIVINFLSQS